MIVKFLRKHPLISVRMLEIRCGIPETTLCNAIAGRRKIPKKHFSALENELKNYGYVSTNNN